MPNVTDLINRMNYMVDDTVDPEEAIQLLNEAQEEIAKDAAYAITSTSSFLAGTDTFALPDDLVELVEVRMQLPSFIQHANTQMGDDGFKRLADVHVRTNGDVADDNWYLGGIWGYEWFGNNIRVRPTPQEPGVLELKYYAMLPKLTLAQDTSGNYSDVPAFRPQYHKILAIYAAMRYSQNWKDVPEEVTQFMNEFNTVRSEMQEDSQWRKERTKNRTVYQMREWR